ncbi:hypothetical protein, partial [Mycobacterium sp. E1214]|uniref:hypothetical protein n=1 Tax=Mycobacterium sp. E1214 TaxID=1834123 RepID=UPI001E480C22
MTVADRLDVAGRLEEGRPAVEHTQSYVTACHALGYQQPGLTDHPAQVRERYEDQDGLDLRALDRDCADLRAAGVAAQEAARLQRAQLAELAAAWTGPGGDAAVRFLQQHCDAANVVATELRAAAQRCESLRDNLWFLVDSKVATAVALDDRTAGQRPVWLGAAGTVTTGVGDRQAAEDVLRHDVMPYVDNDIRDEWLAAMRSASDGVDTSYGMVIDRMAASPTVRFECPDGLPLSSPAPRTWSGESLIPAAPVRAAAATPEAPLEPAAPASVGWPAAAPDPGAPWGEAPALPVGALGDGLSGGLGDGAGAGGGPGSGPDAGGAGGCGVAPTGWVSPGGSVGSGTPGGTAFSGSSVSSGSSGSSVSPGSSSRSSGSSSCRGSPSRSSPRSPRSPGSSPRSPSSGSAPPSSAEPTRSPTASRIRPARPIKPPPPPHPQRTQRRRPARSRPISCRRRAS